MSRGRLRERSGMEGVRQLVRRNVKVAAFPLLLIALTACGASALPLYEGPPTGEPRTSLLMGIEGELRLEGSCLVLAASPGSILLIWPTPGTQWDPMARTVTLDDITARIGDRVELADYLAGQRPEDDWDGWVNKPLAECQYPMAMLVKGMRVR
jgi:hypothetical protein